MQALEQLYGSSQTYTNPKWGNTGQSYMQPMQNNASDWLGGSAPYQRTSPQELGLNLPGRKPMAPMTGGNGLVKAYSGQSQPPLPPNGGLQPGGMSEEDIIKRLYNGEMGSINPSAPPTYRASDFRYNQPDYFTSESGETIGHQSPYWSTNFGGLDSNNWRILQDTSKPGAGQASDNFNLQFKNAEQGGMMWNYRLDPTGKYYVPQGQGEQQRMTGNTKYGQDVWMPLAMMAPAVGGIMGAGAGGAAEGAAAGNGMAGWGTAEGIGGAMTGGGEWGAGMGAATQGGSTAASIGDMYAGTGGSGTDALAGGINTGSGGAVPGGEGLLGANPYTPGAGAAGSTTTGGTSLQDWFERAGQVNQINNQMNGQTDNRSPSSQPGQTNWGQLLGQGLGALYSQNRMQNYGGDLQAMFSRMEQNAQPFLQRLGESYSNPDAYFQSPEYQSMKRLEENRLNRKAGQTGRLANDIDREVLLQDHAAKNINQYRSGLAGSVESLYGNAARYAPMFQAGSTASNSSLAPLFALLGQGGNGNGQGGGIPWDQLWNGGSELWDQYGDDIGTWLGGLFSG